MAVDFDTIEETWRERWDAQGAYEPEVEPEREKFLATYPYSYMNSYAHVGHAFTMMRVDLRTRYERMQGKNVLYPFAYHVTGTPIVAAANRVAEEEPTQIKILEDQGIPREDVPKFADPEHWVEYFPREWRKDVKRLGLGIDWRREFHTTELNPHYDAFIQWQFRKLRDKGLVERGRHPLVWCPKDEQPVADHDRMEGEGETPQPWTLVKLTLQDVPPELDEEVTPEHRDTPVHLMAATLRPDTMFGQTNVWIDAEGAYVQVLVDGARWVVNEEAARKLGYQLDDLTVVTEDPHPGALLVNHHVHAPARDADVPVLPARFVRHERGTGIVTSVPSDAPYDLTALEDLRQGRLTYPGLSREGLEEAQRLARGVELVPIIKTDEYGNKAAQATLEEHPAENQLDDEPLEAATDAAYKAGFYDGVLLDACGPFAGESVSEAKDAMRDHLLERGEATTLYETSGPVRCRCLTTAVVKMVSDQWFLTYSDEEWKEATHAALDDMTLYPELSRKQFDYVVDWLNDWACVRESGLGTRLPWDERWIIESLSDSTIYMAYYTLAPYLESGKVDARDLTDATFDYLLLGEGSATEVAHGSLSKELLESMREELLYWYPVDLRNSGKDLIQNHLTFFVFNHVAMWEDDPSMWPEAMSVNGWVMVDGEKMSKSRGNFITLREALDEFGTTATRMTLAHAGEGLDDANFDRDFAHSIRQRLTQWFELATGTTTTRSETQQVDAWFRARQHELQAETQAHMEAMEFRSALKTGFFDLQRAWNWYLRRSGGTPHEDVLTEFIDVQNRILAPFTPHLSAEVHEALGRDGNILDASWPEADPNAVDDTALAAESYVRNVLDDVKEILQVTGITPDTIRLYVAPAWKQAIHQHALDLALDDDLQMGNLMGEAKTDPTVQPHMQDAPKLAQDLVKDLQNLRHDELEKRRVNLDELEALQESVPFLESEFDASVRVHDAGDDVPDPAGKAQHAEPRRPAIYVE